MSARIDRDECALLIIDVQERYIPALHDAKPMTDNISLLVQVAEILDIPVIITEQYPKGIGKTVEEISEVADFAAVIEKSTFSCFECDDFLDHLKTLGKKQLIITGSETHVCIKKTALDAIERGYDAFIVEDAICSRTQLRKDIGIKRMMQGGALVESAESVIFEFLVRSDGPEFKMVHKLVK